MTGETEHVLDPVSFTTVDEAQVLIKALDDTLERTDLGTADLRAEVVGLGTNRVGTPVPTPTPPS